MFWLTRPPYLRWAAGLTILAVAFVAEFRPETTTPHPFALVDAPAGTVLSVGDVEFRDVPIGLLDPVEVPVTIDRDVVVGQPVLAPRDLPTSRTPDGWWSVAIDLPPGVVAGTAVRLVLDDRTVDGRVVDVHDGSFGEHTGLVAVTGDSTGAVARALRDGSVVVFVGR